MVDVYDSEEEHQAKKKVWQDIYAVDNRTTIFFSIVRYCAPTFSARIVKTSELAMYRAHRLVSAPTIEIQMVQFDKSVCRQS